MVILTYHLLSHRGWAQVRLPHVVIVEALTKDDTLVQREDKPRKWIAIIVKQILNAKFLLPFLLSYVAFTFVLYEFTLE